METDLQGHSTMVWPQAFYFKSFWCTTAEGTPLLLHVYCFLKHSLFLYTSSFVCLRYKHKQAKGEMQRKLMHDKYEAFCLSSASTCMCSTQDQTNTEHQAHIEVEELHMLTCSVCSLVCSPHTTFNKHSFALGGGQEWWQSARGGAQIVRSGLVIVACGMKAHNITFMWPEESVCPFSLLLILSC